jgi:predicted TIM-barrel fold metal-dependent hydrolase
VSILGPEKIIFGTDMPLLDPWTQMAKIRETSIDSKSLDLICGGNIARLAGLT